MAWFQYDVTVRGVMFICDMVRRWVGTLKAGLSSHHYWRSDIYR